MATNCQCHTRRPEVPNVEVTGAARPYRAMPITRAVCQMLFEGLPAAQAVDALLNREIKAEF